MKTLAPLAGCLLAALAHDSASAACYTLIGPDNGTVYQSVVPPFDLSRPLSQSLATQFPGHHLVMTGDSNDCPETDRRPETVARQSQNQSKSVLDSAVFRSARDITQPMDAAEAAQSSVHARGAATIYRRRR